MSSGSPRSIAASVTPRRSGSYGRVEHRVERLARLLVGEPRRRRADQAALPVDDLERAAGHAQQSPDAGEDLVQRLLQPRLRGDGVLVPALPHPWPLRGTIVASHRRRISATLAADRARRGGSGALSLAIRSSEAESPLEGHGRGVGSAECGVDGPGSPRDVGP